MWTERQGREKARKKSIREIKKKVTMRDAKPRQVIKGAVVVVIKTEMGKSLPLVKVN